VLEKNGHYTLPQKIKHLEALLLLIYSLL